MSHKFRWPVLVGSGITLLVLILVFGSLALAQSISGGGVLVGGQGEPSTPSAPIPGGPGYVSLSGLSFRPYYQADQFLYTGTMLKNPGASSAYYIAPVSLPNGAHINQLVMYYYDNDIADFSAILARLPLDVGTGEVMAATASSATLPDIRMVRTTSINNPNVDLQQYSYLVQVEMPATLQIGLVGIRVDYDYPVILPLIRK